MRSYLFKDVPNYRSRHFGPMGKIEQEYADRFTRLFAPEIHNFSTSVGPFWERTQSGLEVECMNNQAVYWIFVAIPSQTRLEYDLADQGRLSRP
jgi:hypothetical protein